MLSSHWRALGRGTISILQYSFNIKLSSVQSVPTRRQLPRCYGHFVRSLLIKHISGFTDAIRPVLPIPISRLIISQQGEPAGTPAKLQMTEGRKDYSSQGSAREAIIVEDGSSNGIETGGEDIRTQVRKLMRRVPHPVAIITSTDPYSPAKTAFRGMTVSSFNTVTLCPNPIVSFNVKVPSETYNAIRSSCRFLVHLLAPNQTTTRLARKFSRGNGNILLEDHKGFFQFQSLRNPGCQPSITEGEPPRLVIQQTNTIHDPSSINLPDFPFILECQYLPQSVKVGNHIIVLGTVVDIFYQDSDCDPGDAPNNLCLTYADTRFWKLGEQIFLHPHTDKS